MAAVIEKRKEKRIKITLPIRIIYQNSEIIGETKNISRLGMYAEIDRLFPLGSELEIMIEIPVYTKDTS